MGHVRDRWMVPGPNGRRVRNERWGHGRRWQARWIEHGVEHSKTFAAKDAADHHLAQVQVGSDGQPVARSLTVAEYADVWLTHQLHYAPSSADAARHRLGRMVLPTLGATQLALVSRADMQALVAGWTKTYAGATVRQAFSFTTTMFATALRDGLIRQSPCVEVNLPPRRRNRVVPLTVDQVHTIAGNVTPWFRSMVVVCAATGLRSAELRALTVDRLVGGDVRVDRQLVGVRSRRPVFGPPKSAAAERVIALGEVASAAIVEHLEQYGSGVDGLLWVTRQGGPVNRKRAEDIWQKATAGMVMRPRSGWHDLRHHHASLLIAAGFSPKAVAERMGHADEAEVLRTYSHLWPSDHARMADAVDAALVRLRSVPTSPDGDG